MATEILNKHSRQTPGTPSEVEPPLTKAQLIELGEEWQAISKIWSDSELDRDSLIENIEEYVFDYFDQFEDLIKQCRLDPKLSPLEIDATKLGSHSLERELFDTWGSLRFDMLNFIGDTLRRDPEFLEFALRLDLRFEFSDLEVATWFTLPRPSPTETELQFIGSIKERNEERTQEVSDETARLPLHPGVDQILLQEPLGVIRAARYDQDWREDFEEAFSGLVDVYCKVNDALREAVTAESLDLAIKLQPFRDPKPPHNVDDPKSHFHNWRMVRREAIEDMLEAAKKGYPDAALELAEAIELKAVEVAFLRKHARMQPLLDVFGMIGED